MTKQHTLFSANYYDLPSSLLQTIQQKSIHIFLSMQITNDQIKSHYKTVIKEDEIIRFKLLIEFELPNSTSNQIIEKDDIAR